MNPRTSPPSTGTPASTSPPSPEPPSNGTLPRDAAAADGGGRRAEPAGGIGNDQLVSLIRLGQQDQAALLDQVAALNARLAELEAKAVDADAVGERSEQRLALNYETVDDFVDQFARVRFESPELVSGGTTVTWCRRWSEHPAAEYWFETLWRSFEEARLGDYLDGGGSHQIAWAEAYFRPVMTWLTSPTGPFQLCGTGHRSPNPIGHHTPQTTAP